MTRTARLQFTLVLLIIIAMLPAIPVGTVSAGSAPMSATTHDITGDETWDVSSQLNAQVVVHSGASLTISNDITVVGTDSSITILDGGQLNMNSGSLTAEQRPQSMRADAYSVSAGAPTMMIPSSQASGAFTLRIISHADSYFTGWTVLWDSFEEDMTEGVHEIEFTSPRSDFQVTFDTNWAPNSLIIDRVEIVDHGASTTYTTPAVGLAPYNMFLYGNAGFNLTIDGIANLVSSSVDGAAVLITGDVTMDSSAFKRSGPVEVIGAADDRASLTLTSSSFSYTRDDHEISLNHAADLTWDANSNGGGGIIDYWEQWIENQEVQVPAKEIWMRFIGLGSYEETTNNYTSNETGIVKVKSGAKRTIGIGYSDGTVWTETAMIEVTRFRTAWNMNPNYMPSYSEGELFSLPHQLFVDLSDEISMPYVEVTEVSPLEEEAHAGRYVRVRVKLVNSGDEPAWVPITCSEVGNDGGADTSPLHPVLLVPAQGSNTTELSWYHLTEGEGELECWPMTPLQLIDENSFGNGSSSSISVSWTAPEESAMPIALVIAALVTVAIALGVVIFIATRTAEDELQDEIELDEDKDEDEEDERIDRFADMIED